MALHRFTKGLDLPIAGKPSAEIEDAATVGSVAIVAADYPGMKPGMAVGEGDSVRLGQLLFEDKKQPGVRYTAPGTGTVTAINRGAKRALQTVVIRLDAGDRGEGEGSAAFSSFTGRHPSALDRQEVRDLLLESGLWTGLRARPFGRVAAPDVVPHSIFVTATDSQPLAPDLERIYQGRESDCERGLHALSRLTDGKVYLCRGPGSGITAPQEDVFQTEEFTGPHPAGTAGLHVHILDPVNRNKTVWTVGLQDVMAIGRLFETGKLDVRRVISLAGPSVERPRMLRTRIGASTDDLTAGELRAPALTGAGDATTVGTVSPTEPPEPHRILSGSVLSGRSASGAIHGYLGRYDQQISVISENSHRELLGWMRPGGDRFSMSSLFLSKLMPGKRFEMTTTTHGSPRAIVPIGLYEKVMPHDLMPTFLLKSLVVTDVERAEELGCMELVEEDIDLCSFVCPGKIDYGSHLRDVLTLLEKEG